MPIQRKNRGFTLIELLVAAGIIVLLVSILIPFISSSFRKAKKFRTLADFQAIAQALEAYKQDFGDIPRLPTDANGLSVPNLGAAVLGKALLGIYGDSSSSIGEFQATKTYAPGECVLYSTQLWMAYRPLPAGETPAAVAPPALLKWVSFTGPNSAFPTDGFNGPGFRVRQGGKSFGPYLLAEKIKHHGLFLMDSDDNPILYSPAKPGRSDVTKDPGAGVGPYVDQAVSGQALPLFNADDNFEMFRRDNETSGADNDVILARIQMMMGDYRTNGFVQSAEAESAITSAYVLWASGPDGIFGPAGYKPTASGPSVTADDSSANRKAVESCDDVVNFKE